MDEVMLNAAKTNIAMRNSIFGRISLFFARLFVLIFIVGFVAVSILLTFTVMGIVLIPILFIPVALLIMVTSSFGLHGGGFAIAGEAKLNPINLFFPGRIKEFISPYIIGVSSKIKPEILEYMKKINAEAGY